MGGSTGHEPLMLALITMLVAYSLYYFALKRLDLLDIPILNAQKGELYPYICWRNKLDLKLALIMHKECYQNQAARVPILGPDKMTFPPGHWLRSPSG